MKQILLITATVLLLTSCKITRDYLSRGDEDKTLFDIVKTLNKHSSDDSATRALPIVYDRVQQVHLKKISAYKTYKDIGHWDKVIAEYSTLQQMYEAISSSGAASRLVNAANYQNDIYDARQSAAEDYYQLATTFLQSDRRDDAKKSYNYFKRSDNYVNGYKDAKSKMDEAFQNAIINVVVNPVQDNSFFFNTGWGNTGYNYSNEYFQQTLIRELGSTYASRYPAKFYTDWEARRDNIKPDWVVDLTLRNMNIPRPTSYTYSRNVSKQIENGRDTSGKTKYQTVSATINITKQSFTARGQMDVNITDVNSRKSISYNSYSDDYRWEEEHATYTGDSRALDTNDWAIINNRNYNEPRKEDVLNELYRKIYPQVKNRITYAVDW
ncbi:hypothetical protein [Ferruginibacter sp. SUN106]|uniref:hypothetical protein n=1 Tax=Ferruginibacter sp. SUN106 TaxID=2978348 RepID=UPI003D36D0DB